MMHLLYALLFLLLPLAYGAAANSDSISISSELHRYRASPKLTGPAKFTHASDDLILNQLDEALSRISTIYIQALFSATHTPELDRRMRDLEIELFDMLDQLYQQKRMADYMKYEGEVTRQMILYNMLKKLFGYAQDENEKIE